MGVEIVKAAMVHGKRLSGNAYKVLITMSLTALDKPKDGRQANLYFGGWAPLALALGHDGGTANDRNSSAHKAVKRAIRELRDGKHVSPLLDACRGTRQSYFVHPGGIGKGGQIDPVKGGQSDPVKGGQNGPQRGVKMTPPRKEQGSTQNLDQDISLQSETELQTAREDEKRDEVAAHKFQGSPSFECQTCGGDYLNRKAHPIRLLRGTA